MDPVAHTLAGATLAEAGLKRLSRYAVPTLIIGANLPDIDVVAHFWGDDTSLYYRRGWSHGVLAMLVLPLVLAGLVWAWHRWRGAHAPADAPPLRLAWIVALAFLATWSHPLLDWMNTYGVRLLMPFSGAWFYGDTLFIIDPWFWLLTAVGVVLARSRSHRAIVGWALLGAAASAVILTTSLTPLPVKLLWLVGVGAIVLLRWRRPIASETVSRLGLATLVVYIGSAYGLARMAESTVVRLEAAPLDVQANPLPGNPFTHRTIEVYDSHYRITQADGESYQLQRTEPDAIVQAALEDESIRGFVKWMRYPYWRVSEQTDHYQVTIWDLRYVDPVSPPRGIGLAEVKVPK